MPNQLHFPCIACGAPVEPEINRDYMSCTYCGTNLEIPKDLRKRAEPLKETSRTTMPKPDVVVDMPKLLRKAQPVASSVLNLFFIWSWVRKLFPACLSMLVFFVLCLLAIGVITFLAGK